MSVSGRYSFIPLIGLPVLPIQNFFFRSFISARAFHSRTSRTTVPDVALVFFEPSFHFVNLLFRYHSLVVEHSRVLLQIFQRRALTCPFAFRRYVIEYVFITRHIKERSLIRVTFTLLVRRCFRQTIRRILNIKNDRLVTDFLYLLSLLIPSAS